jgi:hypothetical protein
VFRLRVVTNRGEALLETKLLLGDGALNVITLRPSAWGVNGHSNTHVKLFMQDSDS